MKAKTHRLNIRCTEEVYEYMRQKSFEERRSHGDILEEMIKLMKLKDDLEKKVKWCWGEIPFSNFKEVIESDRFLIEVGRTIGVETFGM